MIRENFIDKRVGDSMKFRWRSHEVSRIEGLSDAVFAFAVTLLVVSLEVPKTFAELMHAMRCFTNRASILATSSRAFSATVTVYTRSRNPGALMRTV